MDELGLTRYCCRRMLMTHVDLIEKLLRYIRHLRHGAYTTTSTNTSTVTTLPSVRLSGTDRVQKRYCARLHAHAHVHVHVHNRTPLDPQRRALDAFAGVLGVASTEFRHRKEGKREKESSPTIPIPSIFRRCLVSRYCIHPSHPSLSTCSHNARDLTLVNTDYGPGMMAQSRT